MPSLRRDQVGWLLAGAALTLAPHAGHLPPAISALCALLLVWRGLIAQRGSRLPPRTLLVVLAAGVVGSVLLEFHHFFGKEPGIALLAGLRGDVEAVIAGRATAGPQLEAEPGAAPRVVELHAEAGRLATEHRLAAPGAHGEIHQVAKGVVDAHPGDAADQEGQREAEAEGVVDGGQQHHQKC